MRTLPALAALVASLATTASAAEETTRPPNLVVVLVDDLGYADVGFQGSTDIPTPRLDALAGEGVRFAAAYVTGSVCAPSRAGLITGRYPQRFGFERNVPYRPGNPDSGLPREERTLAEALGPRGYVSGLVGKWHLGSHETLVPTARGFDFFFGHRGGGHRYFPEELDFQDSSLARNEVESYRTWIERGTEPVQVDKYLTEAFTDAAVEFIETNADKPFFLMLAYNAPHAPLQATPELLARVAGIQDEKRRTYAAMVVSIDDGVGRVLDALSAKGLREETIVVFLSDNGGPTSSNTAINRPLRGVKGDVWEGGWRVPFLMSWPGVLPAGRTYAHPISSMDIFATITALAGAEPDPERPLDGKNLIPYLTGVANGRPHAAIYLRMFDKGGKAIRLGDYKWLVAEKDRPSRLFELVSDPGEQKDLSAERPEIAAELERRWNAWNAQLVEPRFEGLPRSEWGGQGQRPQAP